LTLVGRMHDHFIWTVAPLHIHVHAVARYCCFAVNRGVAWLKGSLVVFTGGLTRISEDFITSASAIL
jgi:hypothetical protein